MGIERPIVYLALMMGLFDHVLLTSSLAALAVVAVACAGFYFAERYARQRVTGHILTALVTSAVAIIFAVALNHVWRVQRDRETVMRTARAQHLQRLQILLRGESDALKELAKGLRQGRYFTLVANDARQAIWPDDTLSADVERHYPEYFHERERLLGEILHYDNELGRIRQMVSVSLSLADATERYRSDLVSALVRKCAGATPAQPFARVVNSSLHSLADDADAGDDADPELRRIYGEYRCTTDLTGVTRDLFDRAADLADAAILASDAARRYVEETVLRGSCTYAPGP